MSTRTVQISNLGKYVNFLSMSLLVIAVLAFLVLQQTNAIAAPSPLNSWLTDNIIPDLPDAPTAFCDDVTEIPQTECEALVALYESTGGDDWTYNTNWLGTNIPSDWHGVTVSSGHVSHISLYYNNLTGGIPPELGNLTALEWLDLTRNQLSGGIPPELGNLTALQVLYLFDNQLSGGIPTELGNLSTLQWLDLGYNQLSGNVPPELGNLSALRALYLYNNQLTGEIPSALGNLSALEWLYLSINQLTGSIPTELGNLSALLELDLTRNQLTGSVPLSFTNLNQLDFFHFSDTYLCEPTEQEYLDWKETVSDYLGTGVNCFSCNAVTEIPQTECEALVALYESTGGDDWTYNTNWLGTNIPSDWIGVTVTSGHVTQIDLPSNNLTGGIPTELGNLSALWWLALDQNQLTGNIPTELGDLSALWWLSLSRNQLTGGIPTELGSLSELFLLDLSNNHLTGGIPPELGNLTALQVLTLDNNQLSGSIPPELGNLSALESLYLENNQLTGSIPPDLGNLSALGSLYLENNQLTGSIPPELGNLTELWLLYLFNNQLTGSIPPELGNLTVLNKLYLNDNLLSGSVPLSFTNLNQLDYFYFNDTYLCEPTEQEYLDWKSTVTNYQGTGVSCVYDPPEANFSATPITGSAPLTVSYTNTSTGTYTSSAWDFGDGFTSAEKNPTHTFYLAGSYTISLTVSGYEGDDIETKTNYITVTVLAEEEITPEEGGEISFSPAVGGMVSIQVPSGAVDEMIILQVTSNPAVTVPPGSALVGVSFNLTAILDGLPLDGYEFLAPVTIRIDYTDEQMASLDEDSLRLYFWDEDTETWLDAAQTCDPTSTYTRNPDENWFSVEICHLTQYAIFGEIEEEGYSLFLPAMQK